MNFPIKRMLFYSFDQFWPFWVSKTCFFRTVLTGGFNRFFFFFTEVVQNLPTLHVHIGMECSL